MSQWNGEVFKDGEYPRVSVAGRRRMKAEEGKMLIDMHEGSRDELEHLGG